MYSALWCKSNGSFLEGASHPEELVEEAHRLGLRALAITDRDGVYGLVRAHVAAKEAGIALVAGAEVTIGSGTSSSTLILLAADRAGYANLSRLVTKGRLRSAKGESSVSLEEAAAHAGGVLALWGGDRSLLVADADCAPAGGLLKDAFGDRLYALAARHRRDSEAAQEALLRQRAKAFGIPVVAAVETLYHSPARRDLQDVLTCIRHGVTVHTAGRRLKPNAEPRAALAACLRAAVCRRSRRGRAHARGREPLHLHARPDPLPLSLRASARAASRPRNGCAQLARAGAPPALPRRRAGRRRGAGR